jgi:hypothetical protein
VISSISMTPPASGAIVSGIAGMLSAADDRREVARRRGGVARVAEAAPDDRRADVDRGVVERRVVARRVVEAARLATFRRAVPADFFVRVAARLVVVAARRRVDAARALVPRAIWRACFVNPSMRFKTLLTSALVVTFLASACNCLIAARALLSASLIRRSTCRRTSGGTRFSASRSAARPALTARPTMPVGRLLVRFLFAMHHLHEQAARSA